MTNDHGPLTIGGASSSIVDGQLSFIDTHCHLDLRQFDPDREAVIARAAGAGVTTIVNPAVDLASCRCILKLVERQDGIYAAVGVHPNDCADFNDEAVTELRRLAVHPKVVAIGEIGLDYYWNRVPVDQQKRALRVQLALAAELGLPVILHSRSAQGDGGRLCNADLLQVVGESSIVDRRSSIVGVWHAFSGDLAEAQAAYDLGLALGLGGPVTFQNARNLHALAPQLRLDRLMLETDAPYLAPHPHRGQRNEPAYIPLMAATLAQLSGMTVDAIAAGTTATAGRCFTKMAPNVVP